MLRQRPDQPVPCSLVRGVYDFPVSRAEEFLLLELDSLPRRVSQHYVEPTLIKYFGELQGPVEETHL